MPVHIVASVCISHMAVNVNFPVHMTCLLRTLPTVQLCETTSQFQFLACFSHVPQPLVRMVLPCSAVIR